MDDNSASRSTEHEDNEVKLKKISICDHREPSSMASGIWLAQEGRGIVEEPCIATTSRTRSTARTTFSRFLSWKFLRLPSQSVVTIPHFGGSDQNIPNKQERPATTIEEAFKKPYKFWHTQPVPRINEKVVSNEPIIPNAWKVHLKPYTLPEEFNWDTLNINDPLVLEELYIFLNENYVENDDSMFHFDYQTYFIKWVLQPPGWRINFHCGMRAAKSGEIVGFISAIPAQLKIYDQVQTTVEINFLCVHKELRGENIATSLMREMVKRVKQAGIYLAVYTAGVVLPKPIATCRYWLRPINLEKLTATKFSKPPINMSMQKAAKHFMLPNLPRTPGFRKLEARDCENVVLLLNKYLSKFHVTPIFSEEDFTHWFTPQTNIIDSFVVESADGSITDFVSYYTLTFTVAVHHPVYKTLKAAYAFYNVSTKTPWVDLMEDALVTAKNSGFDVFYALDLMENKEFLKRLKFHKGYGHLHYYLFNWKCPPMKPNKMALVLQ